MLRKKYSFRINRLIQAHKQSEKREKQKRNERKTILFFPFISFKRLPLKKSQELSQVKNDEYFAGLYGSEDRSVVDQSFRAQSK